MKWYADNSQLCSPKAPAVDDVLLFGGLAVSDASEVALQWRVEAIKADYAGDARAPIKWNVRDLNKLYREQNRLDVYERILASAARWRKEIFQAVAEYDVTLIVACIETYSSDKETVRRTRDDLARYAFNNGLMRFGLHAAESYAGRPMVILDWPDKGDERPFTAEYAFAFRHGTTADGRTPYKCGPLSRLGFVDSPMFTKMPHSTLLQVADLIVGASREFVECCLEKRRPGDGVACLKLVKDRFRGAPHHILQRGFSVSTGNQDLRSKIGRGLRELI